MARRIEDETLLDTWIGLNDVLRNADETLCQKLLAREQNGKKRKQFVRRIHSRLNKVRAARERLELETK